MTDDKGYYIIEFHGPETDKETLKYEISRLATTFPRLDRDFLNLLAREIAAVGMPPEKLTSAINYAIRSLRYVTVADILGYHKTRLYTYNEMCDMIIMQRYRSDQFEIVTKNFWKLR